MRPKGSGDRAERLQKGRADAQTLRQACPTATLVRVNLTFMPATAPLHAAQSFVLYPAARAYFSYPCPYGDCDGVYDLGAEALRILGREKTRLSGKAECTGLRSRDGLQRQPCGLCVDYTISAQHET